MRGDTPSLPANQSGGEQVGSQRRNEDAQGRLSQFQGHFILIYLVGQVEEGLQVINKINCGGSCDHVLSVNANWKR